MNSKLAGIVCVVSLLGLSGCATMSAEECATGDWHMIGFEDGSMGYTVDRLGQHRKACAKYGVYLTWSRTRKVVVTDYDNSASLPEASTWVPAADNTTAYARATWSRILWMHSIPAKNFTTCSRR